MKRALKFGAIFWVGCFLVMNVPLSWARIYQETGAANQRSASDQRPFNQRSTDQKSSVDQKINSKDADRKIKDAYENAKSDFWVQSQGEVIKVLKDDMEGAQHQRFLLRLSNGHSILIAHNIDLAPRVENIKPGDRVMFYGEYEWNNKGGVVHWTHHDPSGRKMGGWLKHNGRTYE